VAGGGGAGFGVEFLHSLLEEFIGVGAGDEIFVTEEKSGNALETKAIGFVAVSIDKIGKLGIFEGGGDAERIKTGKLGESVNVARRFDGMSIEPIVVHDQEMEGIAATDGGSIGGSNVGKASVDPNRARPEIESKFGKDAAGDMSVFAGNCGMSGIWHMVSSRRAKLERPPVDVEFVVIVEFFNREGGEIAVGAGEIGPSIKEERHAKSPSFHPARRL